MSEFKEYKPMEIEHNVKAAVENLRKAYWSNETEKVAKHFTEAEDKIISAICHLGYTVCKETTEGDCINREALRKEVTEKVNFTTVDGHIAYDKMLKLIDNAQAIPQGEWARHDEWRGGEYIGGFYHVNCPCEDGYYSKWETNFCPNCGLPMKKGGAE